MAGIAIRRDRTKNAMIFYNPTTKQHYTPADYMLDPSRLPHSVFPEIVYDGGLFCALLQDQNKLPQPFPPGLRVIQTDNDGTEGKGTVAVIPIANDIFQRAGQTYMVDFDNRA